MLLSLKSAGHPQHCWNRILGGFGIPLSPNGDQDQFSPNDIHTLSRDKVLRINEMITKEKMI